MLAVHAGLLIDGTGASPLKDATLLVDGDRIAAVGPRSEVRAPAGAEVLDLSDRVLVPGFVDAHTHLAAGGGKRGPRDPRSHEPEEVLAFRAAGNLAEDLRGGITTARVLGEHHRLDLCARDAIERGIIPGPRLVVAGTALRSSAGHGHMASPVNGVEAIRQTIRENAHACVDLTKLFVSGGISDLHSKLDGTYYTKEEIYAAVEESHRLGLPVAIHAKGGLGARWAIEAGVRCVEHGYLLTEEDFSLMLKKGTWLGATLINAFHPAGNSEALMADPITGAKYRQASESHRVGLPKALQMGVKYALGTDGRRGKYPFLMECLVEHFGVAPMDALLAGTSRAAEACCVLDRVGTLEAGKLADAVALNANPLENIRAVRDIRLVLKGGRQFPGNQ